MNSSRRMGSLFCALILAVLFGSSISTASGQEPPAAEQSTHTQAAPLIAIAVTQCGGLVALYVVLDERHMIRASLKALALFEIQADGKAIESSRDPIPFDIAMDLAKRALIQTRVETACSQPGVST